MPDEPSSKHAEPTWKEWPIVVAFSQFFQRILNVRFRFRMRSSKGFELETELSVNEPIPPK